MQYASGRSEPHTMKPLRRTITGLTVLLGATSFAGAATVQKANNTDNLDAATSWASGTAPTNLDIATWSSTVAGANTSNLQTTSAWAGIAVTNPAGAVGIRLVTGRTLTLGTSGIDLSAASQDLTIDGAGFLRTASSASQNWNVASGRTLTVSAAVTAQAGTTTITHTGAGAVAVNGTVSNGSGVIQINRIGGGTTTFGGSGSSSFGKIDASANSSVVVNGPTIALSALSTYGTSTTTGKFELQSGSIAFNGGVRTNTGDGSLIKVGGGTFSATSVLLQRTTSFTSLPSAASSTSGFVATGGSATIGLLDIGTSNSSASALVDGGNVSITGQVNVGNTTNTRYSVLEVRSGSLTSSDATNGIRLSLHNATANKTALLLTGGTTTAERISFGQSTSVANSEGNLVLNGSSAALYLGTGGLVLGAANAYTYDINLQQGTLGAKSSWSSPLNIRLTGGVTLKAADAAGASGNISLGGVLSGTGGFTKSGDGDLVLSGANTYTGTTSVQSGTLRLSGAGSIADSSRITVASGAALDVSTVTGIYTLDADQTLSGSGTVRGALNVAGTLAPGSSPGTLTLDGNVTWLAGGDYHWQVVDALGSAGTGWDFLNITGALDLSQLSAANPFHIRLESLSSAAPDVAGDAGGFANTQARSWTIAAAAGGISGFSESLFQIQTVGGNGSTGFSNDLGGGSFSLAVAGNNLNLVFNPLVSAVPEPGALLGTAVLLGSGAFVRRRREQVVRG